MIPVLENYWCQFCAITIPPPLSHHKYYSSSFPSPLGFQYPCDGRGGPWYYLFSPFVLSFSFVSRDQRTCRLIWEGYVSRFVRVVSLSLDEFSSTDWVLSGVVALQWYLCQQCSYPTWYRWQGNSWWLWRSVVLEFIGASMFGWSPSDRLGILCLLSLTSTKSLQRCWF